MNIRKSLPKWIEAAIILVVAILLIIAGAEYNKGSGGAVDAISTVIGIVMLVSGSLSLIVGLVAAKKIGKNVGVLVTPGALLLAIGSAMVIQQFAGTLIAIIIILIPYILIALGAVVLFDATFNCVKAMKKGAGKTALITIPGMIYGIASIVLGILAIVVPSNKPGAEPIIPYSAQIIILGILLVLVAIVVFILSFIKLPKAIMMVEVDKREEE